MDNRSRRLQTSASTARTQSAPKVLLPDGKWQLCQVKRTKNTTHMMCHPRGDLAGRRCTRSDAMRVDAARLTTGAPSWACSFPGQTSRQLSKRLFRCGFSMAPLFPLLISSRRPRHRIGGHLLTRLRYAGFGRSRRADVSTFCYPHNFWTTPPSS